MSAEIEGKLQRVDNELFDQKGHLLARCWRKDIADEIIHHYNSHDKLQKQADFLTLGLLQEKQKVTKLLEACKVALEAMDKPAVQATGEWQQGLFCGLEDRNITDRYEACMYGYEQALEKVQEWVLCNFEIAIAEAEKK